MPEVIVIQKRGTLTFDGEKLQCNICGGWYRFLGAHVPKAHGWTADDYREEFGLNYGQELCVPELSRTFAENLIKRGLAGKDKFTKPPEYKHSKRRLQTIITMSDRLTGRTLSSKELTAMHQNLEKGKLIVPCHLCGEPTIAWKGHKGVSTCPNCRKAHRATLGRERRRKTIVLPGALPEFGHIVRDGEGRVQCHICGRYYSFLEPHLRIHGLNSDQYREEFGLNRTQALCSPKFSEQARQNLIKSGWAGKLLDYELSRFAESREMRLQASLTQSKVRLGMKCPSTPARIAAAKANYQKALIPLNCEICGASVMAHKAHKHVYCEKCRPSHRLQQMRDWRAEHLEYKNEYFKTYHERKKRGEIRPQRPMTMTEAKIRAQKENQLLSQVKNTEYRCDLCGAVFYGRSCESQHEKHYCPECKPIARMLTIKKWRANHKESCRQALARYRANHLEELRKRGREAWRRKRQRSCPAEP